MRYGALTAVCSGALIDNLVVRVGDRYLLRMT